MWQSLFWLENIWVANCSFVLVLFCLAYPGQGRKVEGQWNYIISRHRKRTLKYESEKVCFKLALKTHPQVLNWALTVRTICYTGTSRPWLCLMLPRCAVPQRSRHEACTFTAPPQCCKLSNRWDCCTATYSSSAKCRLEGRWSGPTGRYEAKEGSFPCFNS